MGTPSTGKAPPQMRGRAAYPAFETGGRPSQSHTPFPAKRAAPPFFMALPAVFSHNPRQATRPVLGGELFTACFPRRHPCRLSRKLPFGREGRPPPFEAEAACPPSGAPKTIKQTCAGTRNMCCSVLCFQYPKAPISGSLGRQSQQCLTKPKLLNII